MGQRSCRVCGILLPEIPLLRFENMPKSAQMLPDADALPEDEGLDLEIYQCPACGLAQTDAEPVSYYREVIRAAGFSEEMRAFRRRQFADWIERYGLAGKRLLEVGCGRGEYLTLLRDAGVVAHGIEYGEQAVEHCLEQGLRVMRGYIEQADFIHPDGPFDAFVVLNFLEHWPSPNPGLRGVANLLRDDGIGLVEVPNLDMILRKRLFTEFISDHVSYFTRESLETTLRLNGFEVLECREVWYGYILSAVVRKRRQCEVSAFEATRASLKREIEAYISGRAVAIWGAGHQALATIALLDLGRSIRYVVDSAPFKQGRFTPSSHVPIVAPEFLRANPVNAIIVMAASYSDEVARLILDQYAGIPHVSILRDDGLEMVK